MHLSHILAADDFDDIALIVRGMKAGPTATLGLAVQGSTASQRVLQKQNKVAKLTQKIYCDIKIYNGKIEVYIRFILLTHFVAP